MRNLFYLFAALLSFGVGWYYYQDVAEQTATVTKLRLKAEDGLVITAGTRVDDAFLDAYVVAQPMPRALAPEFQWALDDTPVTLINLRGQVFGQDVASGSFLQRAHFFLAPQDAFARRIHPGNRAFSIPFEDSRAVENPRGELGYYVVSNGKPKPYRVKARAPSVHNISVLPEISHGCMVADMVAIIGSMDIVMGEVDR